jgi:hypothetical protein
MVLCRLSLLNGGRLVALCRLSRPEGERLVCPPSVVAVSALAWGYSRNDGSESID